MTNPRELIHRRSLLKGLAAGSVPMVAGCLGAGDDEEDTVVGDDEEDTTEEDEGDTTEDEGDTTEDEESEEEEDEENEAQKEGPADVDLGAAANYRTLAKSGISSVPDSAVTGDIGVSPIDSTAITGFSLTMDASDEHATSDQVSGRVFAADYAAPTPSKLTTAVGDMETAYNDAAGRSDPDETELGGGDISGLTLSPGVYKWGTSVAINDDVTLEGGSNDTWIFQIAGDLTMASDTKVTLSGGASVENIVWQVADRTALGTGAQFAGTVLTKSGIDVRTGASVKGSLYAQTDITLERATITE